MAKKVTRRRKLKAWTSQDHRDLKAHSKAKSPVKTISKVMKRTMGAIRQKALHSGCQSVIAGNGRRAARLYTLLRGSDWRGFMRMAIRVHSSICRAANS